MSARTQQSTSHNTLESSFELEKSTKGETLYFEKCQPTPTKINENQNFSGRAVEVRFSKYKVIGVPPSYTCRDKAHSKVKKIMKTSKIFFDWLICVLNHFASKCLLYQ